MGAKQISAFSLMALLFWGTPLSAAEPVQPVKAARAFLVRATVKPTSSPPQPVQPETRENKAPEVTAGPENSPAAKISKQPPGGARPEPEALPRVTAPPEREPQDLLASARQCSGQEKLQILQEFLDLFAKHPEGGSVLMQVAQEQYRLGQTENAIRSYKKVAQLVGQPDISTDAKLFLSFLDYSHASDKGNYFEAFKRYWEQLQGLHEGLKDTSEKHRRLNEAMGQAWEEIVEKLAKVSNIPPATMEEVLNLWEQTAAGAQPLKATLLLGVILQNKNLYAKASRFFEAVETKSDEPLQQEAIRRLSEIHWEQRNYQALEKYLLRWEQLRGELTPEFSVRLGRAQMENGRPAEAARTLQGAIRAGVAKSYPEIWGIMARALGESGQIVEACQLLERALAEKSPGSEGFRWQLAQLYYHQGDYEKAAGSYKQALAAPIKEIEKSFILERLGLCYLKSHKTQEAQKVFRELAGKEGKLWQEIAKVRLQELQGSNLELKELN
jgi:tetratricopeptide (TPR) repeat protein